MRFQPKLLAVIFFVLLLATACTSNREPAPQPEITNPEQEVSEDGPATTVWYDLPEPCRLLVLELPYWGSEENTVYHFAYDELGKLHGGTIGSETGAAFPLDVFWHTDSTFGISTKPFQGRCPPNLPCFSFGETKNSNHQLVRLFSDVYGLADDKYELFANYGASGHLSSYTLHVFGWDAPKVYEVLKTDNYGNPLEVKSSGHTYLLEYDNGIKSPLFGNYFVSAEGFGLVYEAFVFSPHAITRFSERSETTGRVRTLLNLHYEADSLGYASACYKADGSLVYRVEIEAP